MSENPKAKALIKQTHDIWRESFRMARRILKEGEPVRFREREAEEHYYAYAGLIATHLFDRIMSDSAFLAQATEREFAERIETVAGLIAEAEASNDKADKAEEGE